MSRLKTFLLSFFLVITSTLSAVPGNTVLLSRTMNESTDWKLKLVASAESSIEMSVGYAAGTPFISLLQIFDQKLTTIPHFSIKLLVTNWPHVQTEELELLSDLKSKFPDRFHHITSHMVPTMQNNGLPLTTEIHAKILIVDGKYFIVGGSNLFDESLAELSSGFFLTDSLFPRIYHDSDIVGRGPLVDQLRQNFYLLYHIYQEKTSLENHTGPYTPDIEPIHLDNPIQTHFHQFENSHKLIDNVEINSIFSGPRINYGAIGKRITQAVKKATHSVDIGHLYFFPYDNLYKSMVDASSRNVKFTLITNGFQPNSPQPGGLFALESRHHYFPIMTGHIFKWYDGIAAARSKILNPEIYEYNNASSAIYHKKVMIIDNQTLFIGSYNLGKKSQYSDYEIELEIQDPRVAAEAIEMLKEDRQNAVKVSPNQALDWYYSPGYIIGSFVEESAFNGFIF